VGITIASSEEAESISSGVKDMRVKVRASLFAAICLTSLHAPVVLAVDPATGAKYRPAFEIGLDPGAGPIVAAYLHASQSPTPEVAMKRWEAFLAEYAEDRSPEDITDLTLLRQAHFELMRLYYRKGRVKEADRLLKKADDYAVYSVPEAAAAGEWCKVNKFCQ
jgi:hypothetical protein